MAYSIFHVPHNDKREEGEGFTLLELLIVIGILAILATVVVLVLNPAETLKKSRDAQRIADISTIKSALGLYLTSVSTPQLDNTSGNTTCKGGSGTDKIYYSYPSDSPGAPITDATLDGGSGSVPAAGQIANASKGKVDGAGWLPVNLTGMTGGAPLSNFPTDPTNTISNAAVVTNSDFVYRYMCDANDVTFEINAKLESVSYTTNPDNKLVNDGGNNANLYEVGTKLTILGTEAGNDF
ncbi:MAG: Uncharacterized protein G01um101433_152 [Parcubacteria group bacterium Gr01-1014_33]|nr:MAG: Uncharacterized protein G01um101433_152 [Parcubacteria group bacterium Gr01-1014_33]